jgi:glutamate/tyrosine decarboxylase-like PLP-dependent enzyme
VTDAIRADRAAGLTPVAISAVAGSTSTGSVDLVPDLADIARGEELWLHVDAAYGGAARFSPRDARRVPGLELADSVTLDPHKWFFQGYDIGGLLVRDGSMLGATFGRRRPEYYRGADGQGTVEPTVVGHGDEDEIKVNFYKLGFEGTRRWRALKLWLSWKHLGTAGFGQLIELNNDLAAALARRVSDSDEFEAMPAQPELSIVCFRHLPHGSAADVDPRVLDRHQDELAARLQASGDGWLSTTILRGRTYLRAGILNYLTTQADLDAILARLRECAVPESTTADPLRDPHGPAHDVRLRNLGDRA